MRRRVLFCFVLALASGCRGGDAARPIADPHAPPSHSISDATHSLGNPDFFFLPPMVSNPSSSPNWDPGAFNGNLHPTVTVCSLPGTITSAGSITPSTPCDATVFTGTAVVSLADELYQLNWQVPNSSTTFYRIRVSVGATTLGWADVETASNMSQLKNVNTGEFVPLNDGRTLPIKFRIERYALCAVPGVGPCASASVDLSSGGTVSTVLQTGGQPAGIVIPAQGGGSSPSTITVQSCGNFNPRATDLPTFGPCARITADPALPPSGLTNAATVFICDVSDVTITQGPGGQVVDHAQADRITLHRLDPDPDPTHAGGQIVTALPHAPACGPNVASRDASFGGLLAALRHGELSQALHHAAGLLSATPLYAARYIDLGGGGFTVELSDFQFALPARMAVVPTTDGQTADLGTLLPLFAAVQVTDLGGSPVRNAHVHFATSDGTTTASDAVTDEAGLASVGWTIGFTQTDRLTASGRGLAGTDVNGPRRSTGSATDDIVDPFQPIQSFFDNGATPSGPVLVGTGSVIFSAIGRPFATSFESSDASWVTEATQGFWHTTALSGVTNTAYSGLVDAAAGDNSAGALPAPFAGTNALWFGEDARGNYAGDLADPSQAGGTSTARRAGIAVSPVFVVPDGLNAVQLSFESWFEIESVNPSGYDVMQVTITDIDASSTAVLARLNPSTDPGGNARTPLTSGGFNAPPVWVKITRDLSAYRGHHVQLTFSFDTVDPLYNGFRGWVVDDVALSVVSSPAITTRIPLAHADVVNTTPPPARTWHP